MVAKSMAPSYEKSLVLIETAHLGLFIESAYSLSYKSRVAYVAMVAAKNLRLAEFSKAYYLQQERIAAIDLINRLEESEKNAKSAKHASPTKDSEIKALAKTAAKSLNHAVSDKTLDAECSAIEQQISQTLSLIQLLLKQIDQKEQETLSIVRQNVGAEVTDDQIFTAIRTATNQQVAQTQQTAATTAPAPTLVPQAGVAQEEQPATEVSTAPKPTLAPKKQNKQDVLEEVAELKVPLMSILPNAHILVLAQYYQDLFETMRVFNELHEKCYALKAYKTNRHLNEADELEQLTEAFCDMIAPVSAHKNGANKNSYAEQINFYKQFNASQNTSGNDTPEFNI